MSEPLQVRIGNSQDEHVLISIVGRERPEAQDFDDGNWLITPLEIRVGLVSCNLPADLRAEELQTFRQELEQVYERLDGEAVLASLDGWIKLTVGCERGGQLRINGVADDHPGFGNTLVFHIDGLDQSYLPAIIDALAAVEATYPVRSAPGR